MENIPTKVDGVDVLPADQWNQVPTEIENAILSTGITLSSGDLFQLGKAIANYAASGDFYTDSGAADAYVLSITGSKQSPTAYTNGMRVRFIPGNINTGASTVNVASLGVKNIKTPGGADPMAGDIPLTGVTLQYNTSSGWFIIYDIATGGSSSSIFTGSFTSAEQTITVAGPLTLAHSLSSIPYLIMPYLICKTAEIGYSIGDEVLINPAGNDPAGTNDKGMSIIPDATNINIRYGSFSSIFGIIRKDTGASANITPANWKLIIRAWA